MSAALDYYRQQHPFAKDVDDGTLTDYIASAHPEFLQMDSGLAADYFKRNPQNDLSQPVGSDQGGGAISKFLQSGQQAIGAQLSGAGAALETAAPLPPFDPNFPTAAGLDAYNKAVQGRQAETPAQTRARVEANPLFIAGQALEQTAPEVHPVAPASEQSAATRLAGSLGGWVPIIAEGPLAAAGLGLQSAGEHITADYEDARAQGKSEDEAARTAFERADASGALQSAIFATLPPVMRAPLEKYLVAKLGVNGFMRWLTGRVATAAEGGALGASSQAAENVVEGQPIGQGTLGAAESLGGLNLLLPYHGESYSDWRNRRAAEQLLDQAVKESAQAPGAATTAPAAGVTPPPPPPAGQTPILVSTALDEAAAARAMQAEILAALQKNQIVTKGQNEPTEIRTEPLAPVTQAGAQPEAAPVPAAAGSAARPGNEPGPAPGLARGNEPDVSAAGGAATEPQTYIIRHGATDLNAEAGGPDRIRGWTDVPLNDQGRAEAQRLADQLQDSGITILVTSDLSRAEHTAAEISKATGAQVIPDPDLRPWNVGEFTGNKSADVSDKLRYYAEHPAEQVPGGESFDEFRRRVIDAFNRISAQYPDQSVGIVTHYRVARLLEAWRAAGRGGYEIDPDVFNIKEGTRTGGFEVVPRTGGPGNAELRKPADIGLTQGRAGETKESAAPGTETGGTAEPETLETPATSNPTQKGVPAGPGEPGAGTIPVEAGEHPARSAAASRTGTRSLTNQRGWDLIDEIEGNVAGEEGTAPKKSALEDWADKTIQEGKDRLFTGLDPELLAAYAVKGAYTIARIARQVKLKFEDWANQMLAEHGPAIGPYLRRIWPEALKLREQQLGEELRQPAVNEQAKLELSRQINGELAEVREALGNLPPEPRLSQPQTAAAERTIEQPEPAPTAYGTPDDRNQADRGRARLAEIAGRLAEINAQLARPGGGTQELRGERYQLAKEARDIQRQLARNPEYVADLLRQMDQHLQEAERSRAAGNGAGARQAMEAARGIMEGDFPNVPEKLLAQVYNDLVARGEIMGGKSPELPAGRTLGELTRWLQAQKIDSPKLSVRDRFNLAARLGDEFNRGKDAAGNAWRKLASAWEAFKEQYAHPPADDDFRRLMKDWFFQKQWTALETHRWIEQIKKSVPSAVRRAGLSVWLDAGGDQELLRSQRDLVPDRFKPIWEAALNLTDGEKAVGRQVQADFAHKLEDGMNMGLVKRGREDYGVPQLWRVLPKSDLPYDPAEPNKPARKPNAKLDPRDPFFALRRTVPSYFDGIMNGGVPKGLDIADLVGTYNAEFHNALADRSVIKALKDAKDKEGNPLVMIRGGASVKMSESGRPAFFVDAHKLPREAVTKDGRLYQNVDHWALRDWKFGTRDASGNPILVNGEFVVHPDYAKFLRNELSQSWLRDANKWAGANYFNWALRSAQVMKASKFASATFHAATLGEHALFHGVLPTVAGVDLDPARNAKLARLMRNGLDLGFGRGRELFSEGLSSHGGIWAHVPGLGELLGRQSDWLFSEYLPKLKAKVGEVVLDRNLARYGRQLSEDQIYELTANQMNAAFGGQNWSLLGSDKAMLDVSRLLFTAPDFLLSRFKVVGQAFKPYHAEQRYFLLAQAVGVYLAARALNLLLDNDPHWEPENADSVVFNGRAYKARFLVSDLWSAGRDLSDAQRGSGFPFVSGRLGPWPRIGADLLWQRDLRTGSRIDVPIPTDSKVLRAGEILAKDIAEWQVPMGFEGLAPGATGREQTGPGQLAAGLVGVGSRKYTPATQVYGWARDFNRHSPDPAVRLHQEQLDSEAHGESAYRKLDSLLDAGDLSRALGEYKALVEEGHRPQSIQGHYARARVPFTGSAQREAAFRASLSEAQGTIYQRAVQERLHRQQTFWRMLQAVQVAQQQPAPAY